MNSSNILDKVLTKKFAVLSLLLFVFIVVFIYFSNTSRVSITAPNSDEYSYYISDSTGSVVQQKDKVVGSKQSFIKKGNYSITIKSKDGSYFQALNQKGFLQSTEVTAAYKKENSREVYGYNSLDCSNVIKGTLYSYVCGGYVYEVEKHYPATNEQPSFSDSYTVPFGAMAGIASTKEGVIALSAEVLDDGYSTYNAGLLDENYSLTKVRKLDNLNKNNLYRLAEYKDGFIIYDIDGQDAWYYSSLSSNPEEVSAFKGVATNLSPDIPIHTRSSVYGIVSWQSVTKDGAEADLDNQEPSETKIVLTAGESSKLFTTNTIPTEIYVCADNILCIRSGEMVSIYDASGNKLELLQTIGGVVDIAMLQKELLVVRSSDVVVYDVLQNSGYVSVAFGSNYASCGVTENFGAYSLCIIDTNLGSISLYVNLSSPNTDSIEQKIAQLSRVSELESLSIYKNIIYINTKNGEAEYNPQTNSYEYNPEAIKKADASVRQQAKEIGISTDKYLLINPFIN